MGRPIQLTPAGESVFRLASSEIQCLRHSGPTSNPNLLRGHPVVSLFLCPGLVTLISYLGCEFHKLLFAPFSAAAR